MASLTIRQKLMTYLADADDSKVNAIYTLLEKEIQEESTLTLSKEQIQLLDQQHEMHINGTSKSYSREEANQIIKGLRTY